MRLPKTIEGYIKLMRRVEKDLCPSFLKGFDKLSPEDQSILQGLDVEISNHINEVAKDHMEGPFIGSVDKSFYEK